MKASPKRARTWCGTPGLWQGCRSGTKTTVDHLPTAYGRSRSPAEQHQVVPVHDLPPMLGVQLPGGPAEQARQLARVVPDQPAGHRHAVRTDQLDRVAGAEV